MMAELGICDYRVIASSTIEPSNAELEKRCGNVRFFSMTIRVFNLPMLEDRCEDYGQVAWYLGTIDDKPHRFELDDHHVFLTGKPLPVCSNTASMLADTRFASHFRIDGNTDVHFGLFDCGPDAVVQNADAAPGACC